MKKIKSVVAILMASMLLITIIPINAFATSKNSIEDYERVMNELLVKYNLQGEVTYTLEKVPECSVEEFSNKMERQIKFISENIVSVPDDAVLLEKDTNLSVDTTNRATSTTTYGEFKNFALYFRLWCQYKIGTVNGVRKVVAVTDILGSTSFLGALLAFTFEQKSTSYRFLSDGTVEAFAIGDWIDNKNGVRVVYLPGHAIQGIFGEKHL